MKLLNSKKLKLRNKAFVWTGKVRNVVGLNVLSVGCQDLKNNGGGAIGTVGKSQKQFETDEKMKVATQDTTKTSLLTLSGSKISIVVTAMTNQNTCLKQSKQSYFAFRFIALLPVTENQMLPTT